MESVRECETMKNHTTSELVHLLHGLVVEMNRLYQDGIPDPGVYRALADDSIEIMAEIQRRINLMR